MNLNILFLYMHLLSSIGFILITSRTLRIQNERNLFTVTSGTARSCASLPHPTGLSAAGIKKMTSNTLIVVSANLRDIMNIIMKNNPSLITAERKLLKYLCFFPTKSNVRQ